MIDRASDFIDDNLRVIRVQNISFFFQHSLSRLRSVDITLGVWKHWGFYDIEAFKLCKYDFINNVYLDPLVIVPEVYYWCC